MWKRIILGSSKEQEKENKNIKYFDSAELFNIEHVSQMKDIQFIDSDAIKHMSFEKKFKNMKMYMQKIHIHMGNDNTIIC